MNQTPKISACADPLFASLLPGISGLVLGIVFATCATVAGYHFAHLLVPYEYPDSDEAFLARVVWLNVVVPWLYFALGALVSIVLMLFYRRNLRKHHGFLVERLLLSREEKRMRKDVGQLWKIEWPFPLLVIVLICIVFFTRDESYQGALLTWSGIGGLLSGLLITSRERRRIYEDAFALTTERARSDSSSSLKGGLTRRAKILAAILAVVLLAFLGFVVWGTAWITLITRQIVSITKIYSGNAK